jgi:hypothetical protein
MIDAPPSSSVPNPRYAVTLRYDINEDRLLMYCGDTSGHFGLLQLTRRITGSILQGFLRLLADGGPTLLRVPAELQQDVLHFQHQSALAQAAISHTPQPPAPATSPKVTFLVGTVNVSRAPADGYALNWLGTQGQTITMTMSRRDLHCLTHVLQQHAQVAGWDLPALPRWMQPGDDAQTRGASLS